MEPARGVPSPSEPRQEWIYGKLMQLIGPGPAAFYKDACLLMTESGRLESTTHLVSHLLREIESALRHVLEPIVEGAEIKQGNSHKEEIASILRYLDVPEADPVSIAWLKLAERGAAYQLAARAHRRDLSEPRALDQEFLDFWEDMQKVLKIILDKFEAHFASVFDVLDKMATRGKPTVADLNILRNNVPNNMVTWSYFFGKLTSTGWLLPLKEAGFFDHPPEPRVDDKQKLIGYTLWPQSQYLARFASRDPEQVLKIILDIPETGNLLIHSDLADATLAMPPELAANWAKKEAAWLEKRENVDLLLPQKLGTLLGHLAKGGQVDVALALGKSLLGFIVTHDFEGGSMSQPRARLDTWYYEQILQEQLPTMVSSSDEATLAMLCDLLESAIQLYLGGRGPPQDYSNSWRPAVENNEQNILSEPKELLVSAVRDAVVQIIKSEPSRMQTLIAVLEKRRWFIFQRVALHILRILPEGNDSLIAAHLTDKAKFDCSTLWHEYWLLAGDQFGKLSRENQCRILTWIDKGPDLEKMKMMEEKRTGNAPTNEQVENYANQWRLLRLSPIHTTLQGEWKSLYDKLAQQHGEPEHPEYLIYSRMGVGPTSPKNAQELQSLPVSEIVVFLKTWHSSGGIFDSSPEGFGRVLSGVVSSDPERFASAAGAFQELDPTYVRGLLGGFCEAVKHTHCFTWTPVLKLCQWVIEQPRNITDRESSLERDTTWTPTRQTIAHLLSMSFGAGPCELSFDLRKVAWNILQPLTEDPDPTPEREELAHDMVAVDPSNLSINSVRGEALHAVISYALWAKRHLIETAGNQQPLAIGLDEMPEARGVLDSHLDLGREPCLSMRVIYGQHFPSLVYLDKDWSAKRLPVIFHSETTLQEVHDATWEVYLSYCRPYVSVVALLHDEYLTAVTRLGETPSKWRYLGADPKERLAEHLMTLYWHGKLDLESVILKQFWEKAPANLRLHSLSFIGLSLLNTNEVIPDEELERLKTLWNSRLQAITSADALNPTEVSAFGWWFASAKFDSKWALNQLLLALGTAGQTEADLQVINRLKELSIEFPDLAVECLTLMFESKNAQLVFLTCPDQVRDILQSAINCESHSANEKANKLINRLTAIGHTELRNLM